MATVPLETFFLHLLSKVENIQSQMNKHQSIQEEIRTLEFWRSIIAECLASFFYVFLLCGAHVTWPGHEPSNLMIKALTSGLTMATLAQSFSHISGAHVNPVVTFSMFLTRKVSSLRASMYVIAQCGGSIAGAALLYGVTIPGHQGILGATLVHPDLGPWQAFGIEFILTFLVVFTVFATLDPSRRSLGSDALAVGIGYLVTSLSGIPATGASFNPARSLGPAFVMNKWLHHWVYWFGPLAGSVVAGLIYEYIFDTKKTAKTLKKALDEIDRESNLDEDDYDDLERLQMTKARSPQTSEEFRAQCYDQNLRLPPNTYSTTPSTYPASTESTFRTHSAPTSSYGEISGPRFGGGFKGVPTCMEYDTGSAKF